MNGLNRHQNAPVSGVLRSLRKTWLGVRCRIEFKVVYAAITDVRRIRNLVNSRPGAEAHESLLLQNFPRLREVALSISACYRQLGHFRRARSD